MKNNITYPRKETNISRILARLLIGEVLDHRKGDRETGSYRLAGPISALGKDHNWHIERKDLIYNSRDPIGRRATYTEYWLPSSLIKWAIN